MDLAGWDDAHGTKGLDTRDLFLDSAAPAVGAGVVWQRLRVRGARRQRGISVGYRVHGEDSGVVQARKVGGQEFGTGVDAEVVVREAGCEDGLGVGEDGVGAALSGRGRTCRFAILEILKSCEVSNGGVEGGPDLGEGGVGAAGEAGVAAGEWVFVIVGVAAV